MADVYMYVDETGDLGMTGGKKGESRYFGIGTATFNGEHSAALWAMKELRFRLAARGVASVKGFHAKDDSPRTRHDIYGEIAALTPRFDFTLLDKPNAYESVKARGEMYLYQLAWYLHFKEIMYRVSAKGDTVYVAAGTLGTAKRVQQAHRALGNVCRQFAVSRTVHLATWEARTSAGIQIADYGLWAVQRKYENGDNSWYVRYVAPSTTSCFRPWN